MSSFRACILVPTYDNPRTIRAVVEGARRHLSDVVVVDDGSHESARRVIDGLAADGLARVHRRERNGGKGAAVKAGFRVAADLGYSHVLQIDADGQHCLDDVPLFLDTARSHPESLVLGQPVFDRSVPRSRFYGRKLTIFWVHVETLGRQIADPMCGFRVYPVQAALRAQARGNHMDFDAEIAVRMVWLGLAVVNVPTRVRYVPAAEGGVSHFKLLRDNLRITWMHTRLICKAGFLLLTGRLRGDPA